MSIKHNITDYMFDIRDAIRDIRLFVQNMTYEEFAEDLKTTFTFGKPCQPAENVISFSPSP